MLEFRSIITADATTIDKLVKPPLDKESTYSYTMHAYFHGKESVMALCQGEPVGIMLGKVVQDTLFVWKVAVGEEYRGRKLGQLMIMKVFEEFNLKSIEATITESNESSKKMFTNLYNALGMTINISPMFSSEVLGGAESEVLYRGELNGE